MIPVNIYQWLCLFGVPALIAGVVGKFWLQIKGVRMGVKALLRAQMINDYNKWSDRGYAPIYAKQNFENLWEQYHNLKGPNGVMDGLHETFMKLPNEKPRARKENEE